MAVIPLTENSTHQMAADLDKTYQSTPDM
jgi:hypothetical protein